MHIDSAKVEMTVVDLTSTISKGCEPILVDFSRI